MSVRKLCSLRVLFPYCSIVCSRFFCVGVFSSVVVGGSCVLNLPFMFVIVLIGLLLVVICRLSILPRRLPPVLSVVYLPYVSPVIVMFWFSYISFGGGFTFRWMSVSIFLSLGFGSGFGGVGSIVSHRVSPIVAASASSGIVMYFLVKDFFLACSAGSFSVLFRWCGVNNPFGFSSRS